ncbi:MAG: Mitochondrial translocator assembly and maintenance protein 41 [Tremellales sp. Tagirdzhanova-0007]|nr:MAG: Mitochondrial translocator assembly and maintenance protein 41 [Tremellales sp. Tagirdzhanova-0007]
MIRIGSVYSGPLPVSLSDSQKTAYTRLRPVIDTFTAPIDWAAAYGSGVIHQANATLGPPPLTDFLLATPSPDVFHTTNLRQNPSHYPWYARIMGGRILGWLQETWGAGVWYVTMVEIHDIEVKYGIISTKRLRKDLEEWDTLYVGGRLHKPVLPLKTSASLDPYLSSNLRSALYLSLLLLSPSHPFSELALWEQIAGISYSGDPRMSVPGAENPEKVKNIVRGQGGLDGFRRLYEGAMNSMPGLRWQDESKDRVGDWAWRGQGEELLVQPDDAKHFATLLASLPLTLRQNIARHFPPTVTSALVDKHVGSGRASEPRVRQGLEFWQRIVDEERFREVVQNGQSENSSNALETRNSRIWRLKVW